MARASAPTNQRTPGAQAFASLSRWCPFRRSVRQVAYCLSIGCRQPVVDSRHCGINGNALEIVRVLAVPSVIRPTTPQQYNVIWRKRPVAFGSVQRIVGVVDGDDG